MAKAFSLIEVVIVVALSAILMLAITQLYIMYGRVVLFQKSSIDVTLGASSIMDATRTAGLQAKNVVASHTFSGTVYNSGTDTAIFELPSITASGDIISSTYDYVGISASGTNVYHLIDADPDSSRTSVKKLLTDALDEISFVYDNSSFPSVTSVIVNATTSTVVQGKTTSSHLRSHIYLRNL